MVLNKKKDCRSILIKNVHYQEGYGAMKMKKEFPAKTWKQSH